MTVLNQCTLVRYTINKRCSLIFTVWSSVLKASICRRAVIRCESISSFPTVISRGHLKWSIPGWLAGNSVLSYQYVLVTTRTVRRGGKQAASLSLFQGIEVASTGSSNHYVTGVAAEVWLPPLSLHSLIKLVQWLILQPVSGATRVYFS